MKAYPTLLKGPNPFRARKVEDPWRPPPFDAPEVGTAVRSEVVQQADAVANDPAHRTRGLLLLGEAGSGRTHALSTLMQGPLADRAVVVYECRYGPGTRAFRLLASKMMGDLAQGLHKSPHSQLEVLLERVAVRAGHQLPAPGAPAAEQRRLVNNLSRFDPELDRSTARLLLAARAPQAARAVAAWLLGRKTPQQEGALAPVFAERATEDRAYQLIDTVARLAAPERPLVILLDRVERVPRRDVPPYATVRALVAMVCRIHDRTPNCLIVTSCETEIWERSFAPRLNDSERARVLGHRHEMVPLGAEDAAALVAARLRQHLGSAPPDYPTHPFHPSFLAAALPLTPRDLLEMCAADVEGMRERGVIEERLPPGAAPEGVAAESVTVGQELLDAALGALPDDPELDPALAADTLERVVRSIVGRRLLADVQLTRLSDPGGPLHLVLEVGAETGGRATRVGLAIPGPTEDDFTRSMQGLEQDDRGLARVVLVRDEAVEPTWQAGLAAYERLLASGLMKHVGLDPVSVRALAAIRLLMERAASGEVRIDGAPVSGKEVLRRLAGDGVLETIPVVRELLEAAE